MAKEIQEKQNPSEITPAGVLDGGSVGTAPPDPASGASGRVFRFDGVEVDPGSGCVRRNGQEEYLRLKTSEVLRFLLVNRHRTVTKEELRDAVWGDTLPMDGALVQCVADIRKAIGDDPKSPRHIRTIPKVGYRFIADVAETVVPAYPAASPPRAVEEISSVELVEVRQDLVEVEPSRALPAAPPGRARLLVAAAAGLAAAAIAVAVFRRPAITTSLPAVPGRKAVAVLLFENQGPATDLDWLREGLADMVISDLSSSGLLTVLSRQQLAVLMARAGTAAGRGTPLERAVELARRSRAEAFVLGSFTRLGEHVWLEVQLHDRGGALLMAEGATARRPEEILSQVDDLAAKLTSRLTGAPAVAPAPPLATAMTSNLEAYRLYSIALERSLSYHYREAVELLEKAIALDPGFAMAYARIGYVYAVRWTDPERGRPYLSKAFAMSSRLTEKDRTEIAALYAISCRDYPEAIRSYRQLVRLDPGNPESYRLLSSVLAAPERFEEAVETARRGLAVDPEDADLHNALTEYYLDLGRNEEALASARRYLELAPGEANALDTLAGAFQASGRYDEAIATYREALAREPRFDVAVIHLGNAFFSAGRYREALAQFRRYIEIVASDSERRRGHGSLAIVHLRRGDLAEAEREALRCGRHSELQVALVRHDLGRARELAGRLAASPDLASHQPARVLPEALARLALESGEPEKGLALLREMLRRRPPYWHVDTFEDALANALLSVERLDEAITEYGRVLARNPHYPLARYRLALAHQAKGDARLAQEELQRFLAEWKGADPDVPEVVDARRRLSAPE